jgi:dienelactone hydrolase
MAENQLGSYGSWAATHLGKEPPRLSFRREEFRRIDDWRLQARARVEELLAAPDFGTRPSVRIDRRYEYDGLHIEELSWQLPAGPRTKAVFLKPVAARGRLPAVLALHDHGGRKYFGQRKIVRLPGRRHPLIIEHQQEHYSNLGWANEIARRGYAVLVHDGFLFGSRRIRYADVPERLRGGLRERNAESSKEVRQYNEWSGVQESVVASALFCAGTTWPGAVLAEDQQALDVLCARRDVDASRVACGGLSGGGVRTVFLAGMDDRIRAAVCVGFMSTWRDFLLHKSFTHTWMTYLPLAPRDLDFPEILGLRVPLPTLVQNCWQDSLYTPHEMQRADEILQQVFSKADACENYEARFYEGGHKFDLQMQAEAFEWLDRWMG